MPEYIERAKVAEFFERNKQVMWHKDDIAATVSSKSIPAADVAPVVRCKDCVYWYGMGYEGRCEAPKNGLIREYTNYDDFCSYGERKEDVNA